MAKFVFEKTSKSGLSIVQVDQKYDPESTTIGKIPLKGTLKDNNVLQYDTKENKWLTQEVEIYKPTKKTINAGKNITIDKDDSSKTLTFNAAVDLKDVGIAVKNSGTKVTSKVKSFDFQDLIEINSSNSKVNVSLSSTLVKKGNDISVLNNDAGYETVISGNGKPSNSLGNEGNIYIDQSFDKYDFFWSKYSIGDTLQNTLKLGSGLEYVENEDSYTIESTSGIESTDLVPEGINNLYYTGARVESYLSKNNHPKIFRKIGKPTNTTGENGDIAFDTGIDYGTVLNMTDNKIVSPDGTKYKIEVDNAGNLTTTKI
jgi:hypothetical protein